jgi:hypothetical protein
MKFRISILFLALMLLALNPMMAGKVSHDDASRVAINFMFERINQYGEGVAFDNLTILESWETSEAFYVFNLNRGWVIVAARDERMPIIGYNLKGSFPAETDWDYNLKSWLTSFIDEKEFILTGQAETDSQTPQTWDYYLAGEPNVFDLSPRDVTEPLLTALWNQDSPYNLMCPEDPAGPGGRVYVGCVATAMAMIMHYWRYPLQGQGTYSYYQAPYGVISADFGNTFYNWDGMQDQIETENPWDIAEIGFHAAVSVSMNFGPDGSGSYSHLVPAAMKNRFRFSNSAQYLQKSSYSTSQWETILQEQLDQSYPMYYSGQSSEGGHAFVCDGYQGSNYYHFNFGWSGSGNGWYSLQDVGGFSGFQGIVRNLTPSDADYPYIAEGLKVLDNRSGSFTDGSGPIENYPPGTEASWLISPQNETDSIKSISLSFIEFNTADGDMLRIYDGSSTNDPLVGEYSGSNLPPAVTVQNNEMLITFSGNGSAPGFKAEYKTTSPLWCGSSTVFTEPFGTISDGSGDFHYNNLTTCVFILQVPEAVKYHLYFNTFATEEGKDILKIFNGSNQLQATLSGTSIPEPISITSNTVFMTWTTNNTVRNDGWSLSYEVDGVGVEEVSAVEHLSLYPNPSNGLLNINFMVTERQSISYELLTLSGKSVIANNIGIFSGHFNGEADLTGLSKGVYLFKVRSQTGITTRKVVLH